MVRIAQKHRRTLTLGKNECPEASTESTLSTLRFHRRVCRLLQVLVFTDTISVNFAQNTRCVVSQHEARA